MLQIKLSGQECQACQPDEKPQRARDNDVVFRQQMLFRDAINAANLGVKARIIDDGGGFRLVLTSASTGADHGIEIVAAEGAAAGLAKFAFNANAHASGSNLSQSVAAGDADLRVDGVDVIRSSNSIAGVIDGVTLNLTKAAPGLSVAVAIAANVKNNPVVRHD